MHLIATNGLEKFACFVSTIIDNFTIRNGLLLINSRTSHSDKFYLKSRR